MTHRFSTAQRLITSLLGGLLLAASINAGAQTAGKTVVVKRGDSFISVAKRFGVDKRQWRSVYDAQRSGVANPNIVLVGQKFEMVTAADGSKYLRVAGSVPGSQAAQMAESVATAAPRPAAVPAATAPPVAAAPAPVPAAASAETLTIGLIPNIPAPAVLAQYEHLKRYLERLHGHTVRLVVPPSFKAFFDATMAGEYDVSVGPPHMQRVAQLDKGLVPLGIFEPRIGALFITPGERGVAHAREVTGLAVGFANPQSLVAMYGQQWLRSFNLEPGRDYEIKGSRSDMGVGRMLLTGDVAAAIMSNGEYRALPAEESARLKIVEVFARIPNFIWLANPKLDRARIDKLRTQLRGFLADKEDGAAFARATGLSGIVEADEATLRELDTFNPATRRAMGVQR